MSQDELGPPAQIDLDKAWRVLQAWRRGGKAAMSRELHGENMETEDYYGNPLPPDQEVEIPEFRGGCFSMHLALARSREDHNRQVRERREQQDKQTAANPLPPSTTEPTR